MVTSTSINSRLGVGLYSVDEAARIIGTTPGTIGRWIRSKFFKPRFCSQEQTLTFAELMELNFIKMFRNEGVSLRVIQAASREMAARFGAEYPLTFKQFDTDGRSIFLTLKNTSGDLVMEEVHHGQLVFDTIVKPFFRKLEYDNNDKLLRFWPLASKSSKGRVVLDPCRKFGKPIDAESGVRISTIMDALTAGKGQKPKVVADWLGVPLSAVKAAESFSKSLSA